MKRPMYCCVMLFFCLITIGQASEDMMVMESPVNIPQEELLSVESNKKYGLDCMLYGSQIVAYDVNNQIAGKTRIIRDILLYDRKSGDHIIYAPYETESLDHFSLYEDVWSPNEEYLVLPLGRTDGFHILHASQALKYLNERKKGFVRIDLGHIPVLHTFWKWAGDDAFLFSAGHAYTDYQYIYEIGTNTLSALPPAGARFAVTEHGALNIKEKKHFSVLDDRKIAQIFEGMTRDIVLLQCGEPASPRHLPVWFYPSKEGYYHYVFYFWPTNEVEISAITNEDTLRLVAITKVSLEDRGYSSEKPYIAQEYYIFPKQVEGKVFTGFKPLF